MEKDRESRFLSATLGLSISMLGLTMALLALVITINDNKKHKETIAALDSEILEWQRASMPAVKARGWMEVQPEELQPRDLVDVLDPCKERNRLGRELLDGSVCGARPSLSYAGANWPIQIRMAENWPTR